MALIHVIAVPQSAGVAYSPIARLNVCADREGIATIAVAPPGAIDFPIECVLNAPTYETEIAGLITQAGIHTVTVTMNGQSDTVEVEVIALPNNVMIGPETSLDYEGLPITFNLIASCDRPNTLITLSSVGTGITLPDPPQILVDGPPVEFPVTVSNYGEFEVTGAYGLDSSTCYIHSINDAIKLYLEADRDIHTKDLPITFNMRVFCSRDGTVTLSSTGTGVTIPDHIEVVLGMGEFPVAISTDGIKIISALYDTAYTECALSISEEAFLISLGEDRHLYYNGDDLTITKTVFCNKDGAVNLTQTGTVVSMPASVTVVDGKAEFDIVCSTYGNTFIIAESTEEPGVTVSCEIIVTDVPITSKIGPEQTLIIRYQETLVPKLMITSSRAATIPITSTAGFPTTVVVSGTAEITGSITAEGTHLVETPYDDTTITVTKEPNIVRIGPDATNEPVLHVSTNWPGVVTLTVVPDYGYTVPPTVTVGSTLEVDVPGEFLVFGDYVVTATFGDATDTCEVSYVTDDTTGCYITGTLTDLGGQPVRDAEVVFKPVPVTQTLTTGILSRSAKIAHTARDGTFSIRLLRGSNVIAICDKISLRKTFTVPDQETVDIEDV